jgi:hypothetical protein
LSKNSEDGWVDLIFINSDSLIRYNLESGELSVKAKNILLKSCIQVEFDGQYYWLLTKSNDAIVKWDPVSNEETRYNAFPREFSTAENRSGLYCFVDCGKYLLIFPIRLDNEQAYNKVARFEKSTGKITEHPGIPSFVKSRHKFYFPRRHGGSVYIYAHSTRTVFGIDIESDRVIEHKFSLHPDSYDAYRKWQFAREDVILIGDSPKGIFQEKNMLGSFFDYIDHIANKKDKQPSSSVSCCAVSILENVKETLKNE